MTISDINCFEVTDDDDEKSSRKSTSTPEGPTSGEPKPVGSVNAIQPPPKYIRVFNKLTGQVVNCLDLRQVPTPHDAGKCTKILYLAIYAKLYKKR